MKVTKSERKVKLSLFVDNIFRKGNDNPVWETAKETQMFRTVFWTLWERSRVGWFGRMALKHVYYHMWNRSMHDTGWSGWCTGMTQRDRMGRELGGGFRMGNTCTPMADSCQCMAKPIQYCKVISLLKNNNNNKKTAGWNPPWPPVGGSDHASDLHFPHEAMHLQFCPHHFH